MFPSQLSRNNLLCALIRVTRNLKIRIQPSQALLMRFFSDTSEADKIRLPQNITSRKSRSISNAIREYLKTLNFEQTVPSYYLEVRRNNADYCFTIDSSVAKKVVDCITKEMTVSEDTVVIEGNPGLGLITRELLKSGIQHITAFDKPHSPFATMQDLLQRNSDKIDVVSCNIFQIFKLLYMDKLDNGTRMESVMQSFQHSSWESEPKLKIIGVVTAPRYLKHLTQSVVLPTKLSEYGRQEHYIIVNAYVYHGVINRSTQAKTRMFTYSMLPIIMDVTLLCTLPRKAFLPWTTNAKHTTYDESMYLVKLVPKENLFKHLTNEQWASFWFFIKAVCSSKKNRIIPLFEKWVPGSGVVLIARGLSITTESQDLEYSDFLELYKIFISLPGYDHVKFLHNIDVVGEDLDNIELSVLRQRQK